MDAVPVQDDAPRVRQRRRESRPTPMTGTVRRVLLVIAVAVPLVVAGVAPGLAGHDDGADRTDFVVHTYGDGDLADQRRPGGANRSYWVEAYLEGLPTGETMYLARSVFYRPVPTDCGARDTDVVGIDRGDRKSVV